MRKPYKRYHNNKKNTRDIFKRQNKNAKPSVITEVKDSFKDIIETLNVPYKEFYAQNTINAIVSYLNKYGNAKIAYYTIITEVIYFPENKSIDTLAGNIERCLSEVIKFKQKCKEVDGVDTNNNYNIPNNNSNLSIKDMQQCEQIYRILIKIADHASLASYQIGMIKEVESNLEQKVNDLVSNTIDRVKEKVRNDFKGLEKDHITILGIFVAIILAFMGSIIIPSNIISNAANIGTAKLILLMSGISFIFINIFYLLIKFIAIINEKEEGLKKLIPLCKINIVLFIVFVLSLLGVFYTKDFVGLQKTVPDNASKLSIELQK